MYKFVKKMILKELLKKIPKKQIKTATKVLAKYAEDKYNSSIHLPKFVIFPKNESEIAFILKTAYKYKTVVIPRGGGTGATAAALPYKPNCIVISFELMTNIVELDIQNKIAVVEPGLTIDSLQKAVEKQSLFYPPDPSSLKESTIGGNVATNAGGPRAYKYGVTGDYVLGISGYFINGQPFCFGGKHYKNAVGYNLKNLLIGSEGTLALITKIYLRLLPLPKHKALVKCEFDNYQKAVNSIQKMHISKIVPSSAEFIDNICIKALEKHCSKKIASINTKAIVFFELDSNIAKILNEEVKSVAEILSLEGSKSITIIKNKRAIKNEWDFRRSVSPALKDYSLSKISHDIVVPPNKIGAYLTELQNLNNSKEYLFLGYGHLGDGNIHVNILNLSLSPNDWQQKKEDLVKKILVLAVSMGGTISGEHGIGYTKKKYLHLVHSSYEINILKKIKQAFDPYCLLNPKKVVSDD